MKSDAVRGAGKAVREAYRMYDERDAGAPQRRNAPISEVPLNKTTVC